jgi:hypothetical protein
MKHMSARSLALLLLMGAAALSAACTPTSRYVTMTYWQDPSTVYVAYAENEAVGTYAKIQRCVVKPDNSVECAEQANVNALLNPKD